MLKLKDGLSDDRNLGGEWLNWHACDIRLNLFGPVQANTEVENINIAVFCWKRRVTSRLRDALWIVSKCSPALTA